MKNKDFDYIRQQFDSDGIQAPPALDTQQMMQTAANGGKGTVVPLPKKRSDRGVRAAIAALACFAVAITAWAVGGNKVVPVTPKSNQTPHPQMDGIVYFDSYADINKAIEAAQKEAQKDVSKGSFFESFNKSSESTMDYAADGATAEESDAQMKSPAEKSPSFADTNKQVDAVDEADIIKTDGRFIYYSDGESVIIYAAENGNTKEVAAVSTPDEQAFFEDIYLNGDTMVVLGNRVESGAKYKYTYHDIAFAYTYDISDRRHPRRVDVYEQEGRYTTSRMIGSTLYLITNKGLSRYKYVDYDTYGGDIIVEDAEVAEEDSEDAAEEEAPSADDEEPLVIEDEELTEDSEETTEAAADTTQADDADDTENIPFATDSDGRRKTLLPQDICAIADCGAARYTVVGAVDTASADHAKQTKAVLGTAEQVYCNEEHLFIAGIKTAYKPGGDLRSSSTVLARFGLQGTAVTLQATGTVNGTTNDQFSLDEKDGKLRIATTSVNKRGDDVNNLFVLDEKLQKIGGVSGFAREEHIEAVRFMGDTAYVVTFVQTDPLFVIDLKNPTAPKILGEVKLDGFSTYLHPIDETTVLGVGYTTEENDFGVAEKGLKLVTFDVSDKLHPAVLDEKEFYGADSEAQYTHKAFVKNEDKGYFAIPVTNNYYYLDDEETDAAYRRSLDTGALVFTVKHGKITVNGNPDTGDESGPDRCTYIGDYLYVHDTMNNDFHGFRVK